MRVSRTSAIFISVLMALTAAGITPGQNRAALAEAERVSGDQFRVVTQTRLGAEVYSVKRPSSAMLDAIDQGLTDLFAVARKNGYRKRLKYSNYTIFIGRADRTNDSEGRYSPDIAVGAAQYTGTVYDQGGYIYAAGMVVSLDACAFLIAENDRDMQRVSDIVRYEGEHIVLFHNDRRRYAATADHSKGGGHPILQ